MKSFVKLIAAGLVLSSAAEAEDVNVYSYRQPELIKPLTHRCVHGKNRYQSECGLS